MESIKRILIIYILLTLISIFLFVSFVLVQKIQLAIFYGISSTILLFLLYRQYRLLYLANLIYNNKIIIIPPSIVSTKTCHNKKNLEGIVVSTFGLLLRNKVYKWGCDGINGVRLNMVEIDKEHIRLTFGANNEKFSVELLHGMTDAQRIMEIKRMIWHETGVDAELSGFQN